MLQVPPEGLEREDMVRILSCYDNDEQVDAALLRIYNLNITAIQTEIDGKTFRDAIDWIIRQSGHYQHAVRFLSLYSKYQSARARKGPALLDLVEQLWKLASAEAKARAPAEDPPEGDRPVVNVLKQGFFRRMFG